MTVKELITRLLDEDMDAEVLLQTQDKEYKKKGCSGVLFHVSDIEHWSAQTIINFIDWREDDYT